MTTNTIRLEIVSAEEAVFSGQVQAITVTGSQGELGIHPGHSALITPIKPGQVVAALKDGEQAVFFVAGGILEVQPSNITILSDTARRAEDLDEAAALAVKEQAEKKLKESQAEMEYSTALSELAEAAAQLRAIQRLRETRKR